MVPLSISHWLPYSWRKPPVFTCPGRSSSSWFSRSCSPARVSPACLAPPCLFSLPPLQPSICPPNPSSSSLASMPSSIWLARPSTSPATAQPRDSSLGKRASNRPCTPRRLISAPPAVPCLRKLLQINRRHSDGAFLWIRASSRVHAPPQHCFDLPRHRRSPRVVSSRPNGHSRQIKRSIHNISAHHVALEAQHLHPHIPREL